MDKINEIIKYVNKKYQRNTGMLGRFIVEISIKENLIATSQAEGKVNGVLIFRKIKLSKFDPKKQLIHNPQGDCSYVLELCADSIEIIKDLEKQMRERLGKTKHIGMQRRGKIKFYNYKQYINKLLKQKDTQ